MALSQQHREEAISLMSSEISLTEDEIVLLELMAEEDEDGAEHRLYVGPGRAPTGGNEFPFKVASRDQVEPLIQKSLAAYCYTVQEALEAVRTGSSTKSAVTLTEKGRAYLDDLIPVEDLPAKYSSSQYTELAEDDLIELASTLGARLGEIRSEVIRQDTTAELVAVVGALKARREATAPARERIGEYLRQQNLVEADRLKAMASPYSSQTTKKEPFENIDDLRADPYVKAAVLRLSDIAAVVQPVVRDTEAEFYAEQQSRLAYYLEHNPSLPEKQKNILRCIAQGHYKLDRGWGGDRSYRHSSYGECETDRGNGNTMNSLLKKGFTTTRTHGATGSILMLAQIK
jgi:hypothetical protein